MDYYSKITILKKYFDTYTKKGETKEARRTFGQIKILHGKIIENILMIKDSREDNKLEVLSDLERLNFKVIKIIDSCEENKVNDKNHEFEENQDQEINEENKQDKENKSKSKINKNLNSLVLFYAEWCSHCKSLMPTWNALTDLIPKDLINMVKISCVKKQKECSAIKEITGYPTIIFVDMKAGQTVIFNGKRNPESIIEFINECMGGEVLKLD
jgi:thiol-disulfide isomerase/thioredoxin